MKIMIEGPFESTEQLEAAIKKMVEETMESSKQEAQKARIQFEDEPVECDCGDCVQQRAEEAMSEMGADELRFVYAELKQAYQEALQERYQLQEQIDNKQDEIYALRRVLRGIL